MNDILAALQIGIGIIGLLGLWRYVRYTRILADESLRQTEAVAQPAVVAELDENDQNSISLRNVGNGSAISLQWQLEGADIGGKLPFLAAGAPVPARFHAAQLTRLQRKHLGNERRPVQVQYSSMSGRRYTTTSRLNETLDQFDTDFKQPELSA